MAEPVSPDVRQGERPVRVAVLADDLIWSTRLGRLLAGVGAQPVPVRDVAALRAALPAVDRVVVDLTARAYDGVEAVALAAAGGAPVLCLAQHDDVGLRRAALAAGAGSVLPYRSVAERGPELIARWIAGSATRSDEADAANVDDAAAARAAEAPRA